MSNDVNSTIDIGDIFVILIKYLKLWFVLIIVGGIVSTIIILNNKKTFEYVAQIEGPQFAKSDGLVNIIPNTRFHTLLDAYLQKFRLQEDDPNVNILRLVQNKDRASQNLIILRSSSEEVEVYQLFDKFLNFITEQKNYNQYVTNWEKNINLDINKLYMKKKFYEDSINNFQKYYDRLVFGKNETSILPGKVIVLTNVSDNIVRYQALLVENETKIQQKQEELESLVVTPYYTHEVIRSVNITGLSMGLMILISIVLTIFFASVIVFVLEFISTIKIDVDKKLLRKK